MLTWPTTRLLALLGSSTLLTLGTLAGADPKTQMAPFRVEAEFGVDGLRIQNSTSVLNQYLLDQHGVAQLQDISGIAPNLFSSNSDSRGFGDVLSLRGVANSIFFSSPAVVLYVDDVPHGSVSSYSSSLLNIDTLVVKAGPQATEYARNAAGGVIDIKTRSPGARHQGRIQADVGNFNSAGLQAAFDGPVNNQVGYSASFGYAEREGYIYNANLQRSADDRKSLAGRGALYFKPTDTLQLRFGVAAENFEDDAARLTSLFTPLSSNPTSDPYVVYSDLNGETSIDRIQFSFQARKTFDWGTLIATTSRQDWDLDPATTDLDLFQISNAWSRVLQSERVWTQEVRLESKPRPDRSQWQAGVFFFDSMTEGDALREFMVPPSQFVPPGFVQTERTRFDIDQTSLAAYGNYEFPLAEKTMFKFGARAERGEADISRSKAGSNNFGFPAPPEPSLDRDTDREYLSLSAGINHSVSESLSFVARSSLAHKPEGFSGFTADPQLARFDSERSWANEAGVTFGPPKGRFSGSVLGFWNQITDYQFERTVPNSTDFVVVNADEVITRGFEAKFMWNPVERVWWDFQAGYTGATFEKHRDASGAGVSGKRVPFIPRYTLRTGVTVLLGQGFSVNASYAAVGRSYFDERNTAMFAQESYGIVNAQLRYRFDRYTVTLYGQNLFEEEYYQFINPEIFAGSPGAPRRYGVQLSYEY
jgi:outer membrane receptor protein involved in Fe transport